MVVLERKELLKVITIHLKGDMNVCTKFYGNPVVVEISLKTTNTNFMVALKGKVRGSPK